MEEGTSHPSFELFTLLPCQKRSGAEFREAQQVALVFILFYLFHNILFYSISVVSLLLLLLLLLDFTVNTFTCLTVQIELTPSTTTFIASNDACCYIVHENKVS